MVLVYRQNGLLNLSLIKDHMSGPEHEQGGFSEFIGEYLLIRV